MATSFAASARGSFWPLTTGRILGPTVAFGEQRTCAAEARGPHSTRMTLCDIGGQFLPAGLSSAVW